MLHFNLIGYVGKNKTCIGNFDWKLYANLSPKLICGWEMSAKKQYSLNKMVPLCPYCYVKLSQKLDNCQLQRMDG